MQAKYKDVALTKIKLSEERQREEYGDIEELATSIREKGLLQPVGVTEDNFRLVWGGRRFKAALVLGQEKINCRLVPGGLTELEYEELELEENILRKQLTWQEEGKAFARIDAIKKGIHGDSEKDGDRSGWSTRKTAELLNKSVGGTADKIALAHAMEKIPELAECKTEDEARKMFSRIVEDLAITEIVKGAKQKERWGAAFKFAENHYKIGDFFKEVKKLKQTVASLAIVDPPFAIQLDKKKKVDKDKTNLDKYTEWEASEYEEKITRTAEELYRILAEHAWVIWWYGQEWYYQVREILRGVGFRVDSIPATWGKVGASGQSQQPDMYLGRATETFLVAAKGNPAFAKRGQANFFHFRPVPSAKKIHSTEKPIELVRELLDIFTFPGAILVSPFLGSGVDLRAAYSRGLTGFGWDLSQDHKDKFLYRVSQDIEEGLYGNKEGG
jgi:ParB-like chromosome segregation protein Spo0J